MCDPRGLSGAGRSDHRRRPLLVSLVRGAEPRVVPHAHRLDVRTHKVANWLGSLELCHRTGKTGFRFRYYRDLSSDVHTHHGLSGVVQAPPPRWWDGHRARVRAESPLAGE